MARFGGIRALSVWHAAGGLDTMINLVVIAISGAMLVLFLVWWSWLALRPRIETPKYFMLRQERSFDQGGSSSGQDRKLTFYLTDLPSAVNCRNNDDLSRNRWFSLTNPIQATPYAD
jgi:hypothetical protein